MSIHTDFAVQRLHNERAARLHDEVAIARLSRDQGRRARQRRPWWLWLRQAAVRQYRGMFETAL